MRAVRPDVLRDRSGAAASCYNVAMIERALVWNSLEQKRGNLQAWVARHAAQTEAVEERLLQFLGKSADTINTFLDSRGLAWPGARPTHELDDAPTLCLSMNISFNSQEEWRHWASQQLEGRPVAAVDGSQISPNKEYTPALGAVQVGWFVNNHTRDGTYTKQVEFEVITPDELSSEEGDGEGSFAGWYINQQRFVGECRRLVRLMEEARAATDATGAPLPLLLFDGSFIISFASQMLPERSQAYLTAVQGLLDASAHHRVPLVAFIDTSYSRDQVNLIDLFANTQGARAVTDAALMDGLLPCWGDRGPLFLCARDDALSREGRAGFYTDVAFTYMRTVIDQPPARVEMPRWMLEAGLADDAFRILRAECVIGGGYPYTMQATDAVAVLRHEDRERFHALLEQFMARERIPLRRTRKAQSKLQRRA